MTQIATTPDIMSSSVLSSLVIYTYVEIKPIYLNPSVLSNSQTKTDDYTEQEM